MSKIFVIQPHRMLQQAIALSLFPNHEVRMSATVPLSLPAETDAVIVDAAALRQASSLTSELMHAIENWAVPTVWIEDPEFPQVPKRQNFIVLERPIAKDALQSSVAKCLGTSVVPKPNGTRLDQDHKISDHPAVNKQNEIASSAAPDVDVIDLVEVVEDEPGRNPSRILKKE